MAVQNVGYLFAKGLMTVLENAYADEKDVLASIVPDETSDQAWAEWTAMVGTGIAETKAKGEEFPEQDVIVKTPKRVLFTTYGLQVRTPFEDADDDQYAKITSFAKQAGRSIFFREATERAALFNGAFGTFYATGYDGKALIANDHPLDIPRVNNGTTNITSVMPSRDSYVWSNVLPTASDLDYVALTDAITLLKKTPNWEGEPMDVEAAWLVSATDNWSTVKELLNSATRPDTANRSTSAVYNLGLQPISSSRLYDEDAWFVGAKRHDLHQFVRMPLKTRVGSDPTNWDHVTQAAIRLANGFFDSRGWVGSPGA